uniref:Uncharacterized protein n=1 Tax=Strongyloides stercoralis TaxID=6248 RepID=A0A0K0EGE6_STRER
MINFKSKLYQFLNIFSNKIIKNNLLRSTSKSSIIIIILHMFGINYYLLMEIILFIFMLIFVSTYAVCTIFRERKKRDVKRTFNTMKDDKKENTTITENKEKEQNDWCDISLT